MNLSRQYFTQTRLVWSASSAPGLHRPFGFSMRVWCGVSRVDLYHLLAWASAAFPLEDFYIWKSKPHGTSSDRYTAMKGQVFGRYVCACTHAWGDASMRACVLARAKVRKCVCESSVCVCVCVCREYLWWWLIVLYFCRQVCLTCCRFKFQILTVDKRECGYSSGKTREWEMREGDQR